MSKERVELRGALTDVAEAGRLGERVRLGEVELDWAEVSSVSADYFRALTGGAELSELPDGFAIWTLADGVSASVASDLAPPPKAAPRGSSKKKGAKGAAPAQVSPAIWTGSSEDASPRRVAPVLPMLAPLAAAELRSELERKIVADLLGPAGGPEEEIAEPRVSDRYLVGLLAPARGRSRVARASSDALGAGSDVPTDDGAEDGATLAADTMFPSAVGLSFSVEPGTRVRVVAEWGRYQRLKQQGTTEQDEAIWLWRRQPMRGELELELVPGELRPLVVCADQPDVVVRGKVRRGKDELLVSLFLVNGQAEPVQLRDEAWLFQPQLEVQTLGGPRIMRRDLLSHADAEPEERASRMAYRGRVELAVGLGAAAEWEVDGSDPARSARAWTTLIPRSEVGIMSARMPPAKEVPAGPHEDPALTGLCLDMKLLADAAQGDLARMLAPLEAAYAAWIDAQRARVADPAARLGPHATAASAALAEHERARGRIQAGIELLARDESAYRAFSFANRAMWLQRIHGAIATRRRRNEAATLEEVDVPRERTWRTFQLAFLLLNLPALTDLAHEDRSDRDEAGADLLWFPTGGGKTEAYLGVAAYALAIRRLQGPIGGRDGEHGVTVLMRYTLRLLTLQQFQRATSLMCACEQIRREALAAGDRRWGVEPFRIGLWVGGRSTPNKTAQSEEALKHEHGAGAPQGNAFGGLGSPVQLKSCPWCGEAIEPTRDMRVESFKKGRGRTLIFCGDRRGECLFSERRSPGEGLPVLVVDEEIYRKLPALLIATVDKFAQMPWKGQVGMLFGQVDKVCERHGFRSPDLDDSDTHPKQGENKAARSRAQGPLRPPDLIIQDELHLISGPLGTLTALYETAVDELCSWTVDGRVVRPKVIASTATVRRAADQVRSLFLRDVKIFPPSGVDASDNYFAVERPVAEEPGRRYLGICAPGRRLKLALIRVYAAAMGAAQALYEQHGAHADPWMTLVGYFGSLRELGGMRRLVDDDVRSRLFRIDARGLAKRKLDPQNVKELTSRLGSTEIPSLLEQLELRFEPRAADGSVRGRRRPIDVLLATNMISVGVDVPRLGLMVCSGQPKTTAEYIQATSRVGRKSPGLVLTVYNWARPRDMSHYERFGHYHGTFYQHVEANSVTPFSPRALDRGLAAVFVSLVRHTALAMSPNDAAQSFKDKDALVRRAVLRIAERAEQVEQDQEVKKTLLERLEALIHAWRQRIRGLEGGATLGYAMQNDATTVGLLEHAGRSEWGTFTCLDSLRDVETPVALVLDDGNLDASRAPQGGAG
ncbi:MAG: helicase [Polyangiaceae bacterium]|nr:helicase [Polyangiaceae bacterium]